MVTHEAKARESGPCSLAPPSKKVKRVSTNQALQTTFFSFKYLFRSWPRAPSRASRSTSLSPSQPQIVVRHVTSASQPQITAAFRPLLCSSLSSNSEKRTLLILRQHSRRVCCAVTTTARDTKASRRVCARATMYLCGRRRRPQWRRRGNSIRRQEEVAGLLSVRSEYFARWNRGLRGRKRFTEKEVSATL